MNLSDETEFLEIVAGILSRNEGRGEYNFNDWLKAEEMLEETHGE